MPNPQFDVDELVRTLAQTGARWQARATPLTQLSIDQKRTRLGVVVDQAALAAAMAPRAVAVAAAFDPAVDWRNRNGANHVTPPKDQGHCGSCVSFCITGLVESMASIELGQNLDLAEADLHFCSSHGASCNGWWPEQALDQVRSRGIPDEAAFPYASAFEGSEPFCHTVADRDARAVRITSSGTIANVTARKNHLTTVGPASACLHVFEDFFALGNGIYHHVSGSEVGLHCVLVIGYSEADSCWICKNSWGTEFGDGGYFRIAYGECGIDTEFPFAIGTGVALPVRHGWHAPVAISAEGIAPAGAGMALVKQTEQVVAGLFAGSNGAVHVTWLDLTDGQGWHAPVAISAEGIAPPGAGMALVKQTEQVVAGLFVGSNGAVHVTWISDAQGWHAPVAISAEGIAPPGAGMALVKQTEQVVAGLFAGSNGAVHVTWLD